MKKVISIIIVLTMIFMLVAFLPIFSNAATVPSNYKSYALTSADLMYLYREGYLELTYIIAGSSLTTELTEWRFTSSAFSNHNIFYTPIYRTAGTYTLSFDLNLPFDFVIRSNLNFSPNIYDANLWPYSLSGLKNSSVQFSFTSYLGFYSNYSLDYGSELWGESSWSRNLFYFNPYSFSSGSSAYSPIDELKFSYSVSTSKACAFLDFGSSFLIMVSPDTYSRLEGQTGFGTGSGVIGEPSWGDDPITPDIGGDTPSGGGDGGSDITPLISYLQSLDSEKQSEFDDIQSGLNSSISDLSDSSDSAMVIFDNNESLKSDLGLDVQGSSDALSEFDSSLSGVTVSYDGSSYSADYGANLVDFAEDYKTLLQHPLIYFMLFFMITIALASYIIYGRA